MKKNVFMVCAAAFVLVAGTGIVAPLLAPYAQHIGSTGVEVGLLFSGFYMVRLVTGTHIGKLADKKGPKTILTYSLILYPVIAILYALSDRYAILFSARLLHGLASAMMLPMVMTYMGQISPEGQEGRYMGIYNTVVFFANSVGPVVGGVIADEWGYRIAFFSLFIFSVISLLLIILLPSSDEFAKHVKEDNKEERREKVWKNREVLSLAGINIITALLIIFLASFFVLFLTNSGFDKTSIGFLITLQNVIVGSTQMPLGRLIERYDKRMLISVSGSLIVVAIVALRFMVNYWLIAGVFAIIGLALAVILAASSALSAILGRRVGMGQTMGFLGSATSLGYVIGPTVLGFIVDYLKQENSFYFLAGAWLVGILVFRVLYKVRETMLDRTIEADEIEKII